MEQTARNSQGGNTNTPFLKSRAYILTIFEGEIIHFDKSVYECWCDDTCEDGRPHKHHLIYFKNPISFKTIKKVYPKAHIERCHSVEDSINYIMLNEKGRKFNIEERGKRPQKHKFETMNDLKDEESDDIPPYMYSAYSKYKHKPKPIKVKDWLKTVKVFYICGPSGIGKSTKAYELMIENGIEEFDEISYENGFYLGATNSTKACVFDDFRDSRMKPDEFIRFIDYRRHTMNIKGGQVVNDYEFIVITSIKPIDELYKKARDEQKQQWIRRLNVIDLTPIDEDALI